MMLHGQQPGKEENGMKRTMAWVTALMLALFTVGACAAEEAPQGAAPEGTQDRGERMNREGIPMDGEKPQGGRQGGAGGMAASTQPDEALQAILDEVQEKYQLLSYTDPDSGITLQYQLFVPEGAEQGGSYPLIMFIPDSRAPGREASYVLNIGWGGVVWATAEEQAKHPCFVMVPVFTETVVDDSFNTLPQIDVAVKIIRHLMDTQPIDPARIYTTGQSMGGMTSFHLNVAYPDLFAASLFVGSQWDNSLLSVLEDDSFFYIVSAGDDKASTGQSGLMAVFDRDGVGYSHGEWSAKDDAQTQAQAVQALIDQGCSANFVTFTAGTTLPEGLSGSEHLTSFDYAYRLETVRDWLFAQSK